MKFFAASRTFLSYLSLLVLFITLQACGGGGGGGEGSTPAADTTAPVITLNGANPVTVVQGNTYTEDGATATDDTDGTVNVTITGAVDTNTVGNYTVTYTATDAANNSAEATRTVNVVLPPDTTAPVVTLNGLNILTFNPGDTYIEAGATATDDRDGNVSVVITGSVDVNTVGSYTITYTATDATSNIGTTTRTVNVVLPPDTTAPDITLNGASTITLVQGTTYVEAGATATDDRDGNVNIVITGAVDTNTIGTYTVTYTATDTANNSSNITRTVNVPDLTSFITTWKTDNVGVSADNQITISTSGAGYNYTVEWGDGQSDNNVTGNITHTYGSAGTYTISISGTFPRIFFNSFNTDAQKLLSIEQWGDNLWQTMNSAFRGCSNLVGNATDIPNLSQVTTMAAMFLGASSFNQDLSSWNVSSVTDMSGMFVGASSFNQPLSSWNVSSVTSMSTMFIAANSFNQNLSTWDVSSVTDMSGMFERASSFNQDLSSWNVSSVTDMSTMFLGATSFNQNLSTWDVSSVTRMDSMFRGATSFNQPLNTWDVSSVTGMNLMFSAAIAFDQNLSTWSVSSVMNMSTMFSGATSFNQDLSTWDVSSVRSMRFMFASASSFNQPLNAWDVSSVTSMAFMFNFASSFNQDLSTWNVSAVTDMTRMFFRASSFNQNISSWNVSSVNTMQQMFESASSFNQPLSTWDVSSVTNMAVMFGNATSFNQDLSTWDVSLVRFLGSMFNGAAAFNQDISAWNVTSVTSMSTMFSGIALSTANYDALLTGWSGQVLQSDVVFDGGNSQYSSTSQNFRDILENTYGWTVTDGGVVP